MRNYKAIRDLCISFRF